MTLSAAGACCRTPGARCCGAECQCAESASSEPVGERRARSATVSGDGRDWQVAQARADSRTASFSVVRTSVAAASRGERAMRSISASVYG